MVIDEMIEILIAIKEHKPIQWKLKDAEEWQDKIPNGDEQPNFSDCEYRLKEEKQLNEWCDRIHARVIFSLTSIYTVLSSSNVGINTTTLAVAERFGGYTPKNGCASVIVNENPTAPIPKDRTIFVRNGDSIEAFDKMIEILKKLNNDEEPTIVRY